MPDSAPPSRLQSRAYAELRRLIASGEFPPGTFLSERQLAIQFGMSKTPIHVALERLESEGFVTISAQQGIVVRGMSVDDIVDHYELREAIEAWVVRRMAGRLSLEQETKLRENIAQQRVALEADDLVKLMHLDEQMHYLLCSFLNNREIISTMERLRDKIHQVILRVTDTDRTRPAESVEEHVGIVEAVCAGNGLQAADLMTAHLEAGKRRILNPERFARR
jgi:DNA-binding GntR family transcriptional regulator